MVNNLFVTDFYLVKQLFFRFFHPFLIRLQIRPFVSRLIANIQFPSCSSLDIGISRIVALVSSFILISVSFVLSQ